MLNMCFSLLHLPCLQLIIIQAFVLWKEKGGWLGLHFTLMQLEAHRDLCCHCIWVYGNLNCSPEPPYARITPTLSPNYTKTSSSDYVLVRMWTGLMIPRLLLSKFVCSFHLILDYSSNKFFLLMTSVHFTV